VSCTFRSKSLRLTYHLLIAIPLQFLLTFSALWHPICRALLATSPRESKIDTSEQIDPGWCPHLKESTTPIIILTANLSDWSIGLKSFWCLKFLRMGKKRKGRRNPVSSCQKRILIEGSIDCLISPLPFPFETTVRLCLLLIVSIVFRNIIDLPSGNYTNMSFMPLGAAGKMLKGLTRWKVVSRHFVVQQREYRFEGTSRSSPKG
jgi:hypothetical protein